MYMSRIKLRRDAPGVKDLVKLLSGDGYQAHRLIWNIYADSNDRKRDT